MAQKNFYFFSIFHFFDLSGHFFFEISQNTATPHPGPPGGQNRTPPAKNGPKLVQNVCKWPESGYKPPKRAPYDRPGGPKLISKNVENPLFSTFPPGQICHLQPGPPHAIFHPNQTSDSHRFHRLRSLATKLGSGKGFVDLLEAPRG